ncbi:MAG: hypothetical protein CFH07_01906, partial [Alphaproteobacteria bacterium MarineAlpha3_Bin6]
MYTVSDCIGQEIPVFCGFLLYLTVGASVPNDVRYQAAPLSD